METDTPDSSPIRQKPIAIVMADEVDRFPQDPSKRLERASKSETPETDAKLASGFTSEEMTEMHVPASFAMKLERERDEWKRLATALTKDGNSAESIADWFKAMAETSELAKR